MQKVTIMFKQTCFLIFGIYLFNNLVYCDVITVEYCKGANEEYLYCGTACQPTCENYMYDIPCDKPCVKGCFCKPGYVRNIKYKCVLIEHCYVDEVPTPECQGPNEIYHECGTECPDTCDNYLIEKRCPRKCVPGCFCRPGYVRDDIGFCVLPKDCPPPGIKIPPNPVCKKQNETYMACGTACPVTCATYFKPPVRCKTSCVAGCFCNKGLVRDYSNNCIDPQECPLYPPLKPLELPKCKKNFEEYLTCGPSCPKTCESYNTTELCDLRCVEGCFCKTGFVRDAKNNCVPPEYCPKAPVRLCRYLEQPATPRRPCSGTCDEPNKCRPGLSLDICVCRPGTVQDDLGQCIFPEFCPIACYEPNEVFDCGSPCDKECKSLGKLCRFTSTDCIGQCYCKDGYARDHRYKCVQIKYCPRKTPITSLFYQEKEYDFL